MSSPGKTGTLVVANHVSWLDSLALCAIEPVTWIARREVAESSLTKLLNSMAGTRYIDRNSLRGLPGVVTEVGAILRTGRSVAVSPEGTTWCGRASGTFRPAFFQAAVNAGAAVRPVTIHYRQSGSLTTVAGFVGDDTLLSSAVEVIRARHLVIEIDVHPALDSAASDSHASAARRRLAAEAQAAVRGDDTGVRQDSQGHVALTRRRA